MALRDEVTRRRLAGALDLPLPGDGATADRLAALFELGRVDLSLARIAEPHTDAIAILAEAGRGPALDGTYAVWASQAPGSTVTLHRSRSGPGSDGGDDWWLEGRLAFCSGAILCDAALVVAAPAGDPDGPGVLVEVDLVTARRSGRLRADTSVWSSPAFAATCTATVEFDHVVVGPDAVVGDPGSYLGRPGFWHGALGPAAVWAGGAAALVDTAVDADPHGPHRRAELGALVARRWELSRLLRGAGDEVDADPTDLRAAEARALAVRHLVERAAVEVIDGFGRAVGPRPMAFDLAVARRLQELALYVRQSHGGDDLERLADRADPWG